MRNRIRMFCFLISTCLFLGGFTAAGQGIDDKGRLLNDSRIELLLGNKINDENTRIFLGKLKSQPECSWFPTVGLHYCSFEKDGLEFCYNKYDRIIIIIIFRECEEYGQYEGPLPNNLSFSDSRADVHNKLGLADRSGGGQKSVVPGEEKVPIWDKYCFPSYSVHIEYDQEGMIYQMTLAAPEIDKLTNQD